MAAAVQLVIASGDESEEAREWAVAALERLGPPGVADVDQLARLAVDDRHDVAYWAITLLGRLGETASPAVDAIICALSTLPTTTVRQRAAWALGKIGPAATAALPSLRSACDGDDARLARLASRAIGQIAPSD